MTIGIHALTALQPIGGLFQGTVGGAGAAYRIDSATEKFACKFYVSGTSPITDVNLYLIKAGTVTGMNFTTQIQSDSSDAPSGSVLGAATSNWTGPAANGFQGNKTLGSNTGALACNTPYWIVVTYVSGGPPDGSNYIEASSPIATASRAINDTKIRSHDGTNWTNVSASAVVGGFVLTHSDGSMTGVSTMSATGNNGSATDIFSTNGQGIKGEVGSAGTPIGAKFQITKSGSPSALELTLYEGSTQKAIGTLAAADVITNVDWIVIIFDTPAQIAAGATWYMVLRQASSGGTDANDYDLRGATVGAGLLAALLPTDAAMIRGSGSDPTAMTVDTAFMPRMFPLYADPASDFAAGGSGGVIGGPNMRAGMMA